MMSRNASGTGVGAGRQADWDPMAALALHMQHAPGGSDPAAQEWTDELRQEDIVRGEGDWSGNDMHQKLNNTGCRVMTTNAAKKLSTIVDRMEQPDSPHEDITYMHYVAAYAAQMEADIAIIHEPGLVCNLQPKIRAIA